MKFEKSIATNTSKVFFHQSTHKFLFFRGVPQGLEEYICFKCFGDEAGSLKHSLKRNTSRPQTLIVVENFIIFSIKKWEKTFFSKRKQLENMKIEKSWFS